jgi:hypothetical protein
LVVVLRVERGRNGSCWKTRRTVKGDNDTATFYGPAGEVLYSAAGGWGFDLADLTDDGAKVFDAVSTARIAFATERAAGRLR